MSLGTLHELLVGYYLNNKAHIPLTHRLYRSQIKGLSTKVKRQAHQRAQKTAVALQDYLGGKQVQEIYYTPKEGDIERFTGIAETQKINPSDLILKIAGMGFVGLSLKSKRKSKIPIVISNPGRGRLDNDLKVNTDVYFWEAHDMIEYEFPELKESSMARKKILSRVNPVLKRIAITHIEEAIWKTRDCYCIYFNGLPHDYRIKYIKDLAYLHLGKITYLRVTTYGLGKVNIEDPVYESGGILNATACIQGSSSIHFTVLLQSKKQASYRLRLKSEGGPFSSTKATMEYRGVQNFTL